MTENQELELEHLNDQNEEKMSRQVSSHVSIVSIVRINQEQSVDSENESNHIVFNSFYIF
jgi:hypothetical protein